jgi:HK97 family phage portal protein
MLISGGELTLSDSTPIFAQSLYINQAGVNLTQRFSSYAAIYRSQPWVYTVVEKLAKGTSRLPLKVYSRGELGRVEERDHPYARLLRTPNPQHDAQFLWRWTASTRKIYGEAMWMKVRGRDGRPAELWPLHPTNVSVKKNDQGDLIYQFTPGHQAQAVIEIPARDIVHFKGFNPDTTLRGMSPLEPLRSTLLNEDAARGANAAFWKNGARPSAFLSHPGKLSADALARLSANWDSIHGGVDNFGKTAILEEGMEPKILSLSAEESQYIETRKLNREETCAVYDVPPPVVHILDRATFSNITEQMRSMYRDTMAPDLGEYESTLDHQLRPDFEGDVYAEFLMDEVLRGDFEVRVGAIAQGIQTGQLTPNEGRALDNRPALPGGDRLFINSALIPVEDVSVRVQATPPGEGETPLPAPKVPAAAVRSVMGRLGRCTTLADVDVRSLTAGLNGSTTAVLAAYVASDSIPDFKERLRALAEV